MLQRHRYRNNNTKFRIACKLMWCSTCTSFESHSHCGAASYVTLWIHSAAEITFRKGKVSKCLPKLSHNQSWRLRGGKKSWAFTPTLTFGTNRAAEVSAIPAGRTLPTRKFPGNILGNTERGHNDWVTGRFSRTPPGIETWTNCATPPPPSAQGGWIISALHRILATHSKRDVGPSFDYDL